MNAPDTYSFVGGMEVRIALGEFTFRNRLKLIWAWVDMQQVVEIDSRPKFTLLQGGLSGGGK